VVRRIGATPNEELEALAEMTAAINDAPTDDLDIEDEVFPAERVRNYESAQLARGYRFHRVFARHRETGQLAGHTVVVVDGERPHLAEQHDTSVVRAHRGHRLGLLLKADLLLWLRETQPQVESIDTWNAESNDHMIEVNEKLGYRIMGRALAFQRGI
jgi:GNAT superfamily N-acetyltransferase